jgi:hypothetical protein
LSKNFKKVVKKLSNCCQKVVKKMSKSGQNCPKMSKSCQKVVKSSLEKAKIANSEVEDETCGRRRRR